MTIDDSIRIASVTAAVATIGLTSWSRRPYPARAALCAVIVLLAALAAAPSGGRAYAAARNMELLANLPTDSGGDLAFWGNLAIFGLGADEDRTNDGFAVIDISRPRDPVQLSDFRCVASYDDLSVWGDLVFLTVNTTEAGTNCDGSGADGPFSGLRIVSIADPRNPVQIATVNQDCLTAGVPNGPSRKDWINHTPYPDLDHRDAAGRPAPRLIVYTSGGCGGEAVEVPLHDPRLSRVVGRVNERAPLSCHDLSVHVERKIAAVGCFTETQIWDLADLENPRVVARITDPFISGHHGTAFTWDGDTLVLVDERGGIHGRPARENDAGCAAISDAPVFGHVWFYDISVPAAPQSRGHFALDGPEANMCSAHDVNVVPLRDERDVLVVGWYGNGTRVVDFTDPADAQEVAHHEVVDGPTEQRSQAWAAYWYDGLIYTNNFSHATGGGVTQRGLDVLALDYRPIKNAVRLGHLNPQTYEPLPAAGRAPHPPETPLTPSSRNIRPWITVSALKRSYRRATRPRDFRGTANDDRQVSRVDVSLHRLRKGGRCAALTASGSFRKVRTCRSGPLLRASGTQRWRFRLKATLRRGAYILTVRATDDHGATTRLDQRFTVK